MKDIKILKKMEFVMESALKCYIRALITSQIERFSSKRVSHPYPLSHDGEDWYSEEQLAKSFDVSKSRIIGYLKELEILLKDDPSAKCLILSKACNRKERRSKANTAIKHYNMVYVRRLEEIFI